MPMARLIIRAFSQLSFLLVTASYTRISTKHSLHSESHSPSRPHKSASIHSLAFFSLPLSPKHLIHTSSPFQSPENSRMYRHPPPNSPPPFPPLFPPNTSKWDTFFSSGPFCLPIPQSLHNSKRHKKNRNDRYQRPTPEESEVYEEPDSTFSPSCSFSSSFSSPLPSSLRPQTPSATASHQLIESIDTLARRISSLEDLLPGLRASYDQTRDAEDLEKQLKNEHVEEVVGDLRRVCDDVNEYFKALGAEGEVSLGVVSDA